MERTPRPSRAIQGALQGLQDNFGEYLSSHAMRELEVPLNARDIPSTWNLIEQKINAGNHIAVAGIIKITTSLTTGAY